MCPNCFEKEYVSFITLEKFNTFEKELNKKLDLENGLFFSRVITNPEANSTYNMYTCASCDEKWYLLPHDTANPGFFLGQENYTIFSDQVNKINKKTKYRTYIGCLVIYILFAIITYLILEY